MIILQRQGDRLIVLVRWVEEWNHETLKIWCVQKIVKHLDESESIEFHPVQGEGFHRDQSLGWRGDYSHSDSHEVQVET